MCRKFILIKCTICVPKSFYSVNKRKIISIVKYSYTCIEILRTLEIPLDKHILNTFLSYYYSRILNTLIHTTVILLQYFLLLRFKIVIFSKILFYNGLPII